MNSLRGRLLLAAGVILLLFLLFTGLALERAVSGYTRDAERQRLQGLVYLLLGATDADPDGRLHTDLSGVPAPRLRQPESGLVAVLYDAAGRPLWHSPSLLSAPPPIDPPGLDQWRFTAGDGYRLAYGFAWLLPDGRSLRHTLLVADRASPLQLQRASFTRRLWWWLAGTSAGLLVALLGLLHWGLRPLRRVGRELAAIRDGRAERISDRVPEEIRPLARGINALLDHERRQQARFRDALADLAHSLKTPLAVLRAQADADTPPAWREQLDHIDRLIGHQLRRAATAGARPLRRPVALRPLAERLCRALGKVYAERGLRCTIDLPATARLAMDEGDLMELLGNLLDNAAKYGRGWLRIALDGAGRLVIDDDGPGFPPDAEALLRRGARADRRQPGQGIGLAVAQDIVRAYGGRLQLMRGPRGGRGVVALPEATA